MHSATEIETWLAKRIGDALGISANDVDVESPFSEHGLDSVGALQMTGELEVLLGREVAPTLLFEYPTIAALARHLGT